MSNYLNNKKIIHKVKEIVKPCQICCFCPYGQLVEEFPISKKRSDYSCEVFGHDCPVYYHAEPFCEEKEAPNEKEFEKIIKPFYSKFWKTKKNKGRSN